jgi:hypothetical protein
MLAFQAHVATPGYLITRFEIYFLRKFSENKPPNKGPEETERHEC